MLELALFYGSGPRDVATVLAVRQWGVILLIPMAVVLLAGLWLILRPIVSAGRGEDRKRDDSR